MQYQEQIRVNDAVNQCWPQFKWEVWRSTEERLSFLFPLMLNVFHSCGSRHTSSVSEYSSCLFPLCQQANHDIIMRREKSPQPQLGDRSNTPSGVRSPGSEPAPPLSAAHFATFHRLATADVTSPRGTPVRSRASHPPHPPHTAA